MTLVSSIMFLMMISQMLRNVESLRRDDFPDAIFRNCNFQKTFTMSRNSDLQAPLDAVECPEWIVPFRVFKSLAEEYDLELVLVKNSHEFVHENMEKPEFVELMWRLGALGDGNQDPSTLSPDEWEVAYLYLASVLRKVNTASLCGTTHTGDIKSVSLSRVLQ